MKRLSLILLMVVLVVVLVLTGCASPAPSSTTAPVNPAASTPAAPPQAPASSAPAAQAANVIQMKFSYFSPDMAPQPKTVMQPWGAAVEKAANGKVKITMYGGETLVKQADQYDAVASGLCDIGLIGTEVTPGRFPLCGLQVLPGLFPNSVLGAQVFYELLQKYCVTTELKDVKVLYTTGYEPSELFSTKDVKKVSDMKGMKIRTEGRVEQWTMDALGATGVELSMPDTYNGLDRKSVDGCFLQWAGATTFKIQNVTKYRVQTDLFSREFVVAMNLKVWNSLPADVQKAFTDCSSVDAMKPYNTAFAGATAGARQAIVDYDKQANNPAIYIPTAEEKAAWQAAVKPVWDKWVADVSSKGLPGKAMLDDAVALVQKYSQAK